MFSQTTEYALRAMSCLALAGDQYVPTATLAGMTCVPPKYLAKVLQQLADANLIDGRRGAFGGYRLARPPHQIRLIDVIHCISPVQRITACPLGLPNHGKDLCPLHRRLDAAAASVIEILNGVTLREIIDTPGSVNKPLCDPTLTTELTVSGRIRVRRRKG